MSASRVRATTAVAEMSDAEWAQVGLLLVGSYGARVSEVGLGVLAGMLREEFPGIEKAEALAAVKAWVKRSQFPPTYAELRGVIVEAREVARRAEVLAHRLATEPEFARTYRAARAMERGDVAGYLEALGGEEEPDERERLLARVADLEERARSGSGFAGAALVAARKRLAEIDGVAAPESWLIPDPSARAAQVDATEDARRSASGEGGSDA